MTSFFTLASVVNATDEKLPCSESSICNASVFFYHTLQWQHLLNLYSSGSVTLHQWQQLAKPNLGGILHPRPGVLTKDFRELEVDIQHVYSLNDLEEDEPDLSHLSGAHGMGTTHWHTTHTSQLVVSFLLNSRWHIYWNAYLLIIEDSSHSLQN